MDFRQRLRVVTFFALQIYDFGMTARRVTPVGENLNSPNLSGYLYYYFRPRPFSYDFPPLKSQFSPQDLGEENGGYQIEF